MAKKKDENHQETGNTLDFERYFLESWCLFIWEMTSVYLII